MLHFISVLWRIWAIVAKAVTVVSGCGTNLKVLLKWRKKKGGRNIYFGCIFVEIEIDGFVKRGFINQMTRIPNTL